MSERIQLVCFDLGKVLLRICDGWRHACEVAGIGLPPDLPDPDAKALAAIDSIAARYDTGRIDLEEFAREVARHRGCRPQDVVRMHDSYLLGCYPGVRDLLDELSAAGVRTACLSNTSDAHWRMMLDPSGPNHLPLDRLDYRFASHLLGLRKPDDAIYEHVERETGAAPASIVFFDDLPANVEAARRRGWNAYRIDPAPDDPLRQVRSWLARHGVLR